MQFQQACINRKSTNVHEVQRNKLLLSMSVQIK